MKRPNEQPDDAGEDDAVLQELDRVLMPCMVMLDLSREFAPEDPAAPVVTVAGENDQGPDAAEEVMKIVHRVAGNRGGFTDEDFPLILAGVLRRCLNVLEPELEPALP
jgi:hypothetical protein